MTVTLADHPTWPDGDPGKVLLNCIINTNVDETFEELFGSYPETQAKLHKQRNDTNCAESPWVPQRSQLPAQQFVWPAPPAGADPGTPAQGKYRKVRFEAAASMASKAFSSEEIQRVLQYSPGSHYQLETEVYTTAMYGDTFTVISRYTLAGKGPGKMHLHVLYAIAFKPTLSRLMKPMVAKGVDGGIRGSFIVLKKLLQDQYGLSDLPETAPPPSVPGAPAAAAEVAAAPAAAAQVPVLVAPAAPAPGLLALADYVVYQDLVASLVQVSDPQMIAKALAMCLTLVLINMLIMLLRPISQACAAAAANGSGILPWLCWPLSVGLDVPDSLGEVLGALLLVAVANKLLLLGVELAAGALKGSPSPSVAASRAPSMLGAALSAVAAAASSGQQPSAATAPTNGNLAPAAGSAAAQAAAAATTGAGSQSQQGRPPLSPRQQKSSPVAIPSKAGNGSGGGGGGGSGGGVEAALSNFSNAVTGWGRNLLGAGVVDSFASNEGLKALVTGPWSKSNENLKANDAGQGPGSTPAAAGEGAARLSSAGSGPGRAPSHRHTNSFTTVMDPSGLNIIEDYDQQLLRNPSQETVGQLPRLVEEQSAATSPATSEVGHAGPFAAAAAAGAKGAVNSEAKGGKAAAAEALRAAERSASGRSAGSSPARSGSPSKQPAGRSSSPSKMKRAGSSKKALSEAADAEARQPLLSALSGEGSVGQPSSQAGSTTQQQGPGQGASRPSTPVPGDDSSVPPLLDSTSPIVPRTTQSQAQNARSSKSVTFNHSPNTPDSTSGPLAASHSAAAMLTGASKSAGGVVGSSVANSTRSSPLARRSASPMLYGASPPTDGGSAADSPNIGRLGMSGMSASYEALSASSGSSGVGTVPAVEPGQEDADEVLVEVFEHERVQPFRGWGHTWPGHFLPSDKVGHWGDRTGAPGGAVSMLFDRVAPKLPSGWTWLDPEWTVDMTGAEWEGCDTDGWSYGMDFSWITYPPGPQMGKPGLKSFVRRRRWVRMRARLAPGAEAPEEQSQQGSPVLASQPDSMQQQSSSAPNSARDSDGGFMAGLSTGLGLVSNESASAAAAAAGAMVSRFMKAVQDLPLAPRGSSGGSELGLGTSPPTTVSTAPDADKGQQRLASAAAAGSKDTAAGAAAQEEQGEGSVREVGLDAGSKQQQQQQQQAVISSKSSNAGSSRRGGDSGNVSDSDSSSVNSDSPPPRPRLSEALAELRQDQAAGPTQADAAEAAEVASAAAAEAAAAAAKEEQSGVAAEPPVAKAGSSSTAAMQAEAAAPAATKDDSGSSALKEPSAGVEAGKAAPTSAAAGAAVKDTAVAATAPTALEEPPQEGLPADQASVKLHPAPTAPHEASKPVQAAAPQTPAAVVAAAAEAPASAAKEGAGQVADSEQATASKAAVAAAEGEQAVAAPAAATAAEKPRSAGVDSKQKQQQVKVEAVPASGADTGAVSAPTGGAQDVGSGSTDAALAGASRLIPTSSTGGSSAVGSGDWVWSAAEAAAAGTTDTPRSTPRAAQQQQTPLETVGGSGELPSSPLSVDSPTSPTQLRGSGVVNRTSSGGAGRGIVRTGSGARGGRGKQSKLGAVPLRRSGEGSTGGDTTRSSGAGTATSSAMGAGLASAAPSAAVSGGSSGAAAGSSPASRAQPPPPTPAAAAAGAATAGEPAPALAAAGASTSQQSAKAAVLAHVSGDDMGSGLGWPSSPDKQGLPSMQEDRGEGGKPTGADGQQKGAGQKSWDEW